MTSFGYWVFADDQIKMRSLGWVLFQKDRCPYNKREIWTQKDMQRER